MKTVLAVLLTPTLLFGLLLFSGGGSTGSCTPATGTVTKTGQLPEQVGQWRGEQLRIAAVLIDAATKAGADEHATRILLMTAMGESSLQNLDHGDHVDNTTIGVLQQGESYGPRSARLDPAQAATAFLTRLHQVNGWANLEPTIAAHRVQINADPFHYRPFWAPAGDVLTALTGKSGGSTCTAGGPLALPLPEGYAMTDDYGPRTDTGVGASTWHPAVDLADLPGGTCGAPVYSIGAGTVTLVENAWTTIQSTDGYTVHYLHMNDADATVNIGDHVEPGTQIGKVASEGQSTGCHLDLRIHLDGNTNPALQGLRPDPNGRGYVNPEQVYTALGSTLCPPDWCGRHY